MCKSKKAFTWVQLTMSLLILFALSFVAMPRFGESATQARISTCKTTVDLINSQIELYYTKEGVWPTQLDTVTKDEQSFSDGEPTCPLKKKYSYDVNRHCVTYHSH